MSTTLIWGASGGIGRALVQQLAAANWTVGAVSRHPDDLAGLTPHRYVADVTDEFAVRQAVYAIAQELPEIDLWLYAAGDIAPDKVAEMDAATWRRILDANLTGAYLTTHHSAPILAEEAHLVYIGAHSARLRLPGLSAYAAAKAGLEAFTEALAKEERRRRITLVQPGAVDTPFWNKMTMRMPRSAAPPAAIAAQVLAAHAAGHSGALAL